MKIGEVSKRYEISTQTIRYYIKLALLVPDSRNKQYIFSERDLEDLELILKLKSMGFSLSEIHRALSLKRISNFADIDDFNSYIELFRNRLDEVHKEEQRLRMISGKIRTELSQNLSRAAARTKREHGIPLAFLPHLCCPHCGKPLNTPDMQITDLEIMSANLTCSCGYHASISGGILYSGSGISVDDEVVDFERRFYKDSPDTLVSLYQRSYNWIIRELKGYDLKGKIVMEPIINTNCFLFPNISYLDPSALYIITDKHPETILHYKQSFEQLDITRNILFIVDPSSNYPVKKESIDLIIDYMSTCEFAAYQSEEQLPAKLLPYLTSDARWLTAIFSLPKGSRSLHQFFTRFPKAHQDSFQVAPFVKLMNDTGFRRILTEDLGSVKDSGDKGLAFSYHVPGDALSLSMLSFERTKRLP